jgi:predicted AAA+ superfamily ATPase
LRRQLSDVDLTVRESWRGPLEAALKATPPITRTVFIDEVQRIPALLDGVRAIVDAHPRRFRFPLCGSSARKLPRGRANLLPGRIVLHYLHPLLARELQSDFNLDRVLAHGTLPGIYADRDSESRSSTLRSYVDAYRRQEIQPRRSCATSAATLGTPRSASVIRSDSFDSSHSSPLTRFAKPCERELI